MYEKVHSQNFRSSGKDTMTMQVMTAVSVSASNTQIRQQSNTNNVSALSFQILKTKAFVKAQTSASVPKKRYL